MERSVEKKNKVIRRLKVIGVGYEGLGNRVVMELFRKVKFEDSFKF